MPRFKSNPKEYYNRSIKAQTILAFVRKVTQGAEESHHGCQEHEHSHEHGHMCIVMGMDMTNIAQHSDGCCGVKKEYQEPINLQHFKALVQSFANPNLHNGNKYLGRLNEILFAEGNENHKLTLKGIKELAKTFASNDTCLVSEIADLIITTKTGENTMKLEGKSQDVQQKGIEAECPPLPMSIVPHPLCQQLQDREEIVGK